MNSSYCPGRGASERRENKVGFSLSDAAASMTTPASKFVLFYNRTAKTKGNLA